MKLEHFPRLQPREVGSFFKWSQVRLVIFFGVPKGEDVMPKKEWSFHWACLKKDGHSPKHAQERMHILLVLLWACPREDGHSLRHAQGMKLVIPLGMPWLGTLLNHTSDLTDCQAHVPKSTYFGLDWLSSPTILDLACVLEPCYLGLDCLPSPNTLGLIYLSNPHYFWLSWLLSTGTMDLANYQVRIHWI
jgi:hypothetical protein